MKKLSAFLTGLAASLVVQPAGGQTTSTERRSVAHIGFVYPLSTNGLAAPQTGNSFSFHALAGVGASENGFALAGLTNVIKHEASGLQIAGISNHTGGCVQGVQIAGLANTVRGRADGFLLAGLVNTTGGASGLEIAGIASISTGDVGAQLAGIVNGAQDARLQIAGIANVAGNVDGLQVAGLVNRAKVVRGVQLAGLINIADSSDAPIGLINIIGNGEMAAGATLDESGNAMLGFRSGGKWMYGILAAGHNLSRQGFGLWALEGGLGLHLAVSPHFRINLEGSLLSLGERRMRDAYLRSGLRVLPAVTIGRHLEIFAGPSFNQVYYTHTIGRGLQQDNTYVWQRQGRGWFSGLYFGGLAGVQLRF